MKASVMPKWLIAALAFFLAAPFSACAGEGLVFGMLPYVSPGELARQSHRLKMYLSEALGQPVTLVTAPDFKTFAARTQRGEYDLVFTAPHLARLAQTRDGYKPVARTMQQVQGVFLVAKDSPIQRLEDLRGKRVMIAEPKSILFLLGKETLNRHGLILGRDVAWVEAHTHNNAMFGPLRGEADAAVSGRILWQHIYPERKAQLRQIDITQQMPGFVVLANPRMPAATVEKLRQALAAYKESPQGRQDEFITKAFKGFGPVSEAEMAQLDPYVKPLLEP